MNILALTKLVIFLPLLSAIINGSFSRRLSNHQASFIAIIFIALTVICTTCVFIVSGIDKKIIHIVIARWISIKVFLANWSIYVDQLTAIMLMLVASISFVVHLYSVGYMKYEKNLGRFFSYLSLFTFFMFILVSSDNFFQLFFGWEGVGVCSYFLIGYYYQKESANKAAIKAFIVNRISDFAFVISIIIMLIYTETLEFSKIFERTEDLTRIFINILGSKVKLLDIICFMLFIGCAGKSAQIGMHIWLPDAMEAPTPVSALIHSATMVTAGVFLMARCSFMFEYSPNVLSIITVVGSFTAIFAATIAITQTDIKKIIAYSTCSQLGYMFFACGVSSYQAGIFHLVNHGFFKALLFLSAGNVIHATHEQEIFRIGGIWKKMPITYANFWIGSLAMIGIFPLAGFYSKDLILGLTYISPRYGSFAFILGISAALLTAIYSFKIIVITFHKDTKLSDGVYRSTCEVSPIMNLPLSILVAGSLFSGMIGSYIFLIDEPSGYFCNSIFNFNRSFNHSHIPLLVHFLPMLVGVAGSIISIYCYKGNRYKKIVVNFNRIYCLLKNKYYFDEGYNIIFIKKTNLLAYLSRYFDIKIDKFGPNGLAYLARRISLSICRFQTGYINDYILYIVFFLVLYMTIYILKYFTN